MATNDIIKIATISEMFISAINDAIKSAKSIVETDKKAMAYASIAQALAATGNVSINAVTNCAQTEPPSNVVSMPEGKESLKNKLSGSNKNSAKKADPVTPVIAETPPSVVEPEISEQWTEQSLIALQAETDFVTSRQEQYGAKLMDDLVKSFSSGALTSIEDINPANIQGFVAYIEACEAEEAASA